MDCCRGAGTPSEFNVIASTTLNSLMSRFSSAKKTSLFFCVMGPPSSKPYRCLLADVAVADNGSVALKGLALSAKNRAPCHGPAPGLVAISILAPSHGGFWYSEENKSGFTRMEAMELFGGSVLLF